MATINITTLALSTPSGTATVIGVDGGKVKRFPIPTGGSGSTGPTGPTGPAGTNGTSSKWLTGTGVPASSLGANTDMYINLTTYDVYGPKSSGAWGSIVANIKGAAGSTGATGPQGPSGSGGLTNPMTAPGDVIIGGTSGAPTRLAKGANSTVLTIDATTGLPVWATPTGGSGGFANPMTTAGDLIVGGTSGAPTRLPKGANNTFLRVNASGNLEYATPTTTAASNATNVVLDGIAGKAGNVDAAFEELPTIFRFGAIGTGRNNSRTLGAEFGSLAAAQAAFPTVTSLTVNDQVDWAALQAACTWMDTNKKPISLAGAKLNINRWVVMGSDYCDIHFDGAEIGGQSQSAGKIDGATGADTSYPTNTDPGPMRGCVFYFPNTIYYAKIRNGRFYDLRFGIAFNKDPNSPTFYDCYFGYTNCGVITYQGSQTPSFVNCGGDRLGVLYIGSATCFPAGSPYAGIDNYYTDGLKILNAVNGGFDSGGIDVQSTFDAWFIASFLRPTTDSITITGTNKYTDKWGTVYTDAYTDGNGKVWPQGYFLNPTGRMAFVPYRTIRLCYTFTMLGADTRGTTFYGMALVNTEINAGEFGDVNYEGMFNYDNINDDRPVILTCGAFVTASVKRQSQISYIENDHGLFEFTGRGQSSGKADGTSLVHIGTNPIIKKNQKVVGFTRAVLRHVSAHVPIIENVAGRAQGYASAGNPKDYRVDLFEEKVSFGNQETEWLRYTIPQIIQVPSADAAGVVHNDAIISYIENICGYMHVQVYNHTTGEKDYAIYDVDNYSAEVLTLANAVNNGDTVVTFTSAPRLISGAATRFCTWRPGGTGNGFSTNRYLGNNQIEVVNRVAGLSAPLAANSTVQRAQKVQVAKAFAGTFAQVTSIGLGNALPGQESSQIGLKNVNGHSLTFVVWYSHFYSHD